MFDSHHCDSFVKKVTSSGLHLKNAGNLKFKINTLFNDIDFTNKRVLDIGGGSGIFTFYAGWMGAKEAICLEPEAAGSTAGTQNTFNVLKKHLLADNCILQTEKFQNYDIDDNYFDIIMLHDSINHLNEEACIRLKNCKNSRNAYIDIFSKMNNISNSEATIIVTDCSRYNIFPMLKMTNPFLKSIEWHKHQSPKTWANLLGYAGFINPKIMWLPFNSLRQPGRILFGNKFTIFFINSYFCLKMYTPAKHQPMSKRHN